MIYGYARVSTAKQSIDRQERNILAKYPTAKIERETYTGSKYQGRDKLEQIVKHAKAGDTIVFDSVSRMSRNAEEGCRLYFFLYDKGVDLEFLREPQINSTTYRESLEKAIPMTGDKIDSILKGVNEYLKALAQRQIELAFEQSQKELDDLRQRTREGIETAKRAGKQIGQQPGRKLNVKKALVAKKKIKENAFEKGISDVDCIKICGISRKTYYKYKREIIQEMAEVLVTDRSKKQPYSRR